MRRPGVLVAAVVGLTVALAGCDWPMFGFDADRGLVSRPIGRSARAVASGSTEPAWTGTTSGLVESSPAVAHGVVYVGDNDHKLYAFDAAGNTGCSDTPKTCTPLWTATRGGGGLGVDLASPTVANGVVYIGAAVGLLYAFDASGKTNCSGTPTTCTPLWIAPTGGGAVFSSPVVAGGVVYVGSDDDKLFAFDAAGNTNCSGVPKVCAPLWSATTDGEVRASPAVGERHRLCRFQWWEVVCVPDRVRDHGELFGHAHDVQSVVDGRHVRQDLLRVACRGIRSRVCRLRHPLSEYHGGAVRV